MREEWNLTERNLEPPEPKTVCGCDLCGESILEGDDMVELEGERYHLDCFKEEAAEILTKRYGAKVGVAEEYDGRF